MSTRKLVFGLLLCLASASALAADLTAPERKALSRDRISTSGLTTAATRERGKIDLVRDGVRTGAQLRWNPMSGTIIVHNPRYLK